MKKSLCFFILIAATLCAAESPFIGNWKVTYRLAGLLWTDHFQITAVNPQGRIFATDEWGNKITGFVKDGVAVLKGADNPYFLDTWIFSASRKAKHMGFYSDLSGNIQGEIDNAAAVKITDMPAVSTDNDRPFNKLTAVRR